MVRGNLRERENIRITERQINFRVERVNCSACNEEIKEKEGFFGYLENGNIVVSGHVRCLVPQATSQEKKEKIRMITCP